jgi:glycosyltransferase involved in cell wall biosynthesis
MNDSAVVIIATTGRPSLRRAVESVLDQTHENTRCLVVVDGPKYHVLADMALSLIDHQGRVDTLYLPENTGSNGFVCHRIYGAVPYLVNEDFIFYLDDDNTYKPNHVGNLVKACIEQDASWGFSLRSIFSSGEFICRDDCESLGYWPVWYNAEFSHIDTNCYCLRRELSVKVAPRWHKSRIVEGQIQPSADTELCNFLRSAAPNSVMVPEYTVNYELGSSDMSVKPEFFEQGNAAMMAKYDGALPWQQ